MQFICDKNLINKTLSDSMNAVILQKCRSITFREGKTSKKYKNLIMQIHNFKRTTLEI